MLFDCISKYKPTFDSYTELRAQINSSYTLELNRRGVFVENSTAQSGVSARIFANGAFGFAASAAYDDDSVRWVLETAKKNAGAIGRFVKRSLRALPGIPSGVIPINYSPQAVDTALLRAACEDMKQYAERKYPQTKCSIWALSNASEKLLVVKSGCDGRSNIVLGSITVSMEAPGASGETVEASEALNVDTYLNEVLEKKRLYELVDSAYAKLQRKIAEEKKEKAAPECGVCECILSPDFTGMLAHEAVGHTCEADAVITEGSVAFSNMGKQVASSLVSLTDFAYDAYGIHCPIPMHIDDEGVACKDAPIIRDGILVGCMTNRLFAEQLGVENTGNARASEYYDEPIVRMRNTCFHKGTDKLEDMISSIKKGYYLTRSGGGNGGVKGDFYMEVSEGYEINNGKLGRPIRPTSCTGIAWEVLKSVDMISNHFENPKNCGICGKKQGIPTSQGGPEMKLRLCIGG